MRRIPFIMLLGLTAMTVQAQQKRDKTDFNAYIEAVDEYVPAPGQFTNEMPEYEEGDNHATMAAKCSTILIANSTDDEDHQGLVCLGAYGGYITFHFDHSIANIDGQDDLKIVGNAFAEVGSTTGGSSEPGIIMVSKDVNHNWLPDDPWYELSGSADVDSTGKVAYDYEITYQRVPMQNIPWTDNKGGSGTVSRNSFHQQEYFPLWVEGDALTFQGTLLPKSGILSRTGYIQQFYRCGYVDNRPDDVTFDIANAVDGNREPVQLDFIDFVRVYSATNQAYPMIGETSTEVRIVEDNHLSASLEAIEIATSGISVTDTEKAVVRNCYSLDGRSLPSARRGLMLIRMSDGTVRKTMNNSYHY